jgi:hypothetical protein
LRIVHPYTFPHSWLKGNFHTHTTLSDGKSPLADVIAMYRDDNYDFLAITDHRKYWTPPAESDGGMLLMPGQECHVTDDAGTTDAHVVSLGARGHISDGPDMQRIIDSIREAGGAAIVAHPRWTYMAYETFAALRGYAAFEVWNGGCSDVARAASSDYWDWYLSKGLPAVWGVGTDDMHNGDHDFGTGWTWANSAKDPASILDAISRGDCYATSGPRIETIRVDGDTIVLHTSPAKLVKFMASEGRVVKWVEGKNVRHAEYRPSGTEIYVRAEVHAHDGTVAWTNPFTIEP